MSKIFKALHYFNSIRIESMTSKYICHWEWATPMVTLVKGLINSFIFNGNDLYLPVLEFL
jgi:hypothetical protein